MSLAFASRTALLRARLFVPVVALLVADAAAQSPPAPAVLDPIVVTASRTPQRLLQRQPGVEIIQNGGPGSTSGVFLRGANTTQTLVLIDGMRVASASSGAT